MTSIVSEAVHQALARVLAACGDVDNPSIVGEQFVALLKFEASNLSVADPNKTYIFYAGSGTYDRTKEFNLANSTTTWIEKFEAGNFLSQFNDGPIYKELLESALPDVN